jgi:type VI protein secretion system component Hcp
VSFNFAKIEVEYKQQKPDGSLVSGGQFRYDLKANKAY